MTAINDAVEDILKFVMISIDKTAMQDLVMGMINKNYLAGHDEAEKYFDRNFTPDKNALAFLNKFGFENINDLTEELKIDLRKQLSLGLMNQESVTQLAERIQNTFDISIGRAKTIAQTESYRAYNMGYYAGAKQSGLILKKQWITQPHRDEDNPCEICKHLDQQIVGIDEHFEYDGKQYFLPGAHPNCKCRAIYLQD